MESCQPNDYNNYNDLDVLKFTYLRWKYKTVTH